ncbi:Uncharacterised protein [BD1-7 clade bacterium]|uniref:Uncharacterized protein n=1 Tax=BD1-7 clade bacterium TaxID=2029982 RepID=A0A5S9PAR4_9GAMM|nr:Uncharacterised protein [BD1-7 clade bacterium]
MQKQHASRLTICTLGVCSLISFAANADEAESFSIDVKGKSDEIQMTYKTDKGTELQNAINFTVHDPDYGMRMLCKGKKDQYDKHAHTSNSKSAEIKFDHDYKGDKRDSCDDVSSDIKSPYWIANMAPIIYYESSGALRGCTLANLPSGYGNFNRAKYDLLPSSDPLHNQTGIPLSAVYVDSGIGFEFDATTDQILNVGDVDDSHKLYGQESSIDKSDGAQDFNCDPRVGDDITLTNMASYNVQLAHTINFGYNVKGVDLIEPGQKDYPAYRFNVTNNTGADIDLINSSLGGSYLEYCENTTPLETAGYVFKEAASWVFAAELKADEKSKSGYKIADIANKNKDKQLDKLSDGKTTGLFSDCNDGNKPVRRNFFDSSNKVTVAAGETKDVTGMFVLDNFDNFYDITVSYQMLPNGEYYVYSLSPNKAYSPITFNSGFHDITITLDSGDKASLASETDTGFTIVNDLHGGKSEN